ncbi:hypothetical protein [Actibacterium sp. 188UL27-1]|uniref:hypothetical protein n=1 Tax=Actibacterium sp. 188UL27-1 TaxID=2786961 RepID=UPI00195EC774|nr:hypothetical protein [Actibacterium sp. 188UL27-1]MBM7066179.1 hypothetical protein [Actibacterium sp. 188UL27-1]
MLKRLLIVFVLAFAIPAPMVAQAQSGVSQIERQLQSQGYTSIRASRTILGRIRIVAMRGDTTREIVYNPSTGVIMRDFSRRRGGGSSATILDPGDDDTGNRSQSGGRSAGGRDDDDDDDDDDDGGDDDGGDDGDDDGDD